MSLFPTVNEEGEVVDGKAFRAPGSCRGVMRHKCQQHYQRLEAGCLARCPYGLFSFKHENGGISTGIVIQGRMTKRAKRYVKGERIQWFRELDLVDLLGLDPSAIDQLPLPSDLTFWEEEERARVLQGNAEGESSAVVPMSQPELKELVHIRDMVHDLKLLNARIFDAVDLLKRSDLEDDPMKWVGNVEAAGEIMDARMRIYDFLVGNQDLAAGDLRKISVHGAFLKSHRIIASFAHGEAVHLHHNGQCFAEMLGHNTFAIVPFLVFENAIKYSPENERIEAVFQEQDSYVDVVVKNIGPSVQEVELERILKRGGRGSVVQSMRKKFGGQGIGLYIVKEICDLHGIKVSISSDQCRYKIDHKPYSQFVIQFRIPKCA